VSNTGPEKATRSATLPYRHMWHDYHLRSQSLRGFEAILEAGETRTGDLQPRRPRRWRSGPGDESASLEPGKYEAQVGARRREIKLRAISRFGRRRSRLSEDGGQAVPPSLSLHRKIRPARYRTIRWSAVKSRLGRSGCLASPPDVNPHGRANGICVGTGLAGYLTKDRVVALQDRKHKGPVAACLVRSRTGSKDYDIAFTKLVQAASSSGVSQSFASADSAAKAHGAIGCASVSD